MSGWKEQEEAYPLRGNEPYHGATLENNAEAKDGSVISFVPNAPPPPGFILPPSATDNTDNSYATQPPYNPSYKAVEDTIAPRTYKPLQQRDDSADVKENETANDDAGGQYLDYGKDSFATYCIVTVIIAIAIAVICGVIYLGVKHPKLAKALHSIATEVRKPHDDDETPVFKKYFNPAIAKQFAKHINETVK